MTDMTEPTARNIAKYVVVAIVQVKATKQSRVFIADHTPWEEDDPKVGIPANVIGWWTAAKLKPVTDKIVDKTADLAAPLRAKLPHRKSKKSETK